MFQSRKREFTKKCGCGVIFSITIVTHLSWTRLQFTRNPSIFLRMHSIAHCRPNILSTLVGPVRRCESKFEKLLSTDFTYVSKNNYDNHYWRCFISCPNLFVKQRFSTRGTRTTVEIGKKRRKVRGTRGQLSASTRESLYRTPELFFLSDFYIWNCLEWNV